MITEQELERFSAIWAPQVMDKRGLNKEKVIKALLEYSDLKEVWDSKDISDVCYIELRTRNKGQQYVFNIITPTGHYSCMWLATANALMLQNNKPLPAIWHNAVSDGIRKLLQNNSKSAMVQIND